MILCEIVVLFAVITYKKEDLQDALLMAQSSGVVPSLTLNNGKEIPKFGFGTWLGFNKAGQRVQVKEHEVELAVQWAIDAGYRHIDTASIYNTEKQVGKGINKKLIEGVVKREDLFVTTKLWNNKHAKEDVVPALRESLSTMNLEYVDLYLIHWPVSLNDDTTISDVDYLDTWQGMIQAQALGLTRSIGVSNFNEEQIERVISSGVTPQVLQVEVNLNLQLPTLRAYCQSHNITVTGYTPFGSIFYHKAAEDAPPPRVDDAALVTMSEKYNKTVPQVVLRYLVDLGVIPIPKSTNKTRVESNIDIFDFDLTEDEKKTLATFDKNYRTIPVTHWKESKYYPFEINK